MFTLSPQHNGFRLKLPKEFLLPEVEEKYTKILQRKHSFYMSPIEFLNETIQHIDILGFDNAIVQQVQPATGFPVRDMSRVEQNDFQHTGTPYTYRSEKSPISIMDMTINVMFRHTNGYINYFMLFENFWYQYTRDTKYSELPDAFYIDLFNERGVAYSRIKISSPIMNSMDMISFDYTQPIAQNANFKVDFKYSDFDYEFIDSSDHIEEEEEIYAKR